MNIVMMWTEQEKVPRRNTVDGTKVHQNHQSVQSEAVAKS